MKVVDDNLTGDLSLADKVWNDAMETAALHCEGRAESLRAANGESESWVWPCADRFIQAAEEFRKQKRTRP